MKKIIFISLLVIVLLIIILSKLKYEPINDIVYFSFHYKTGNASNSFVNYKIECNKNCIATIKMNEEKKEKQITLDYKYITSVEKVLNKYKVSNWNGFNKADKKVLDGKDFDLNIKTKDKKTINASGYEKYPKNYYVVKDKLDKIFLKIYNDKN